MATNAVTTDPGYLALQAYLTNQSASEAAQRAAAVQRLLVEYGEIPAFNASPLFSGDVTDVTRGLANESTTSGVSALARLNAAAQMAKSQMMGNLRERGMLDSGELGYQLGQNDLGYKQGRFDLSNSVLNQLQSLYGSFAQNEAARQYQLSQALIDAMGRQANNSWNWTDEKNGSGGAGGGGAWYQPTGYGDPAPGGTVAPPAASPTTPAVRAPSPYQLQRMAKFTNVAARDRPADIVTLFQQFLPWRQQQIAANNKWWVT